MATLSKELANVSIKGQTVNIFGFVRGGGKQFLWQLLNFTIIA
jgi:hypothetical protein